MCRNLTMNHCFEFESDVRDGTAVGDGDRATNFSTFDARSFEFHIRYRKLEI